MARTLPTCALLLLLGSTALAQFSDLQPGRNFPTALIQFGTGRSENVDIGDVDHDGDYDVVIANGGDGSAQANEIYINEGGIQGGTEGTFTLQTATRFAGVTVDTSRDVELVDVEDDGDLDVYISNRGNTVNGGEVSRAYTNQGGLQAGNIGFFTETTDGFWGALVSVPLSSEDGVQDGTGPWRDFSCDCDFGDIDNDGDLDLFHSSYGPNIQGTTDSRVFLNDGDGVFDELWPWADASADIQLHTLDIDLLDLDDDFDLDIFASSRESQARIYRNDLGPSGWTGAPFTDVTQTALIDTGATPIGQTNYEAEYADLDGDGDFDIWAVNYLLNTELLLRNQGGLTFEGVSTWVRGDPSTDDNEVDFLDYDGDGDLDAFAANFQGENWVFQSGLVQGLTDAQGLYHRNGTSIFFNLAPWPEAPDTSNAGTSLDGECADMDGDGDPDIILANDQNQPNRYWENALGVPDTHAPTFHAVTVQGDKSDGSDTPILAAVRDNASYYVIGYYDARLVYSVDGGREVCLHMFSQGGQQFRAVIPGGIDGQVDYRIEVTDDAGNTGVSSTFSYAQTSTGTNAWELFDCGTPGVAGRPYLTGDGPLTAGSTNIFDLRDAAPNAAALLFLSAASTPVPFKGGFLYTNPIVGSVPAATDAAGQILFGLAWPAGIPTGFEIWWQWAVADAAALGSVAISNALLATAP